MNVLSCFDGMSCGQQALGRLELPVENYYAYEIDKYAIQITQKNYPNTIQMGDINQWPLHDLPKIDLILAGSPCQGFSFAGKQLNFDDPRSKLFFEFVKLWKALKAVNPDIKFLLENVKMKQESLDVISQHMGVEPILINSALVSAQNRNRWYWTNIENKGLPADRGISLADIIESGNVDTEKSYCLDASYFKGSQNGKLYLEKSRRQIVITENETILHNLYGGFKENFPRVFNGKAPTLRTAAGGGHIPSVFTKGIYKESGVILKNRLLTPLECERLQTVAEGYTEGVSKTQRYRMLGNGWTVDVIVGLLQSLKK